MQELLGGGDSRSHCGFLQCEIQNDAGSRETTRNALLKQLKQREID
jgi:hypothetical protein